MKHDVALTKTARLAVSVNSKHREVQLLGRTAKEIAAEIGEELIKVNSSKPVGGFRQWVEDNCTFTRKRAYEYINVYEASVTHGLHFRNANSIREVLALGKTPKEPAKQTRAATLDDLRKVERLRALRDNPGASEGERENAQRKLDEIEKEVGKVEPSATSATHGTGSSG